METETKLSHLPGPGRIHLRKGMVAELTEHRLQLVLSAQKAGLTLPVELAPGLIESGSKAVGVAELPIGRGTRKGWTRHDENPKEKKSP